MYCVVISGLAYVVSPQEFLVVVEQDSHRVKAGLLQLNPTLPLDTDACMIGSDVSLAEYPFVLMLLHLCFCSRDYGLTSVLVDFD